ncbi:MAG: isoprenyl transferase [Candidatus Omnitrophica bacterium]|nr:isoprenyl transferase [Candidatus Omnitrophota bacterium]MDD5513297.1 isoprenyl transferase [Candidatus Omnitrophota bacterium]
MIDKNGMPRHIAIIMDGNGRWAQEKGLPRSAGHREGVKRVEEIVKRSAELGIEAVTFFAFSTENWNRPKQEIDILMRHLESFLNRQARELARKNIRLKIIGSGDPIPRALQDKMVWAQAQTEGNTGMTVVLALNYGARQEIVDAAKKFAAGVASGEKKIDDLNTDNFGEYLYTAGLPDPDLLIRTSSEKRLSNFLLWQLSYAELHFPKKYWPDFRSQDLDKAVEAYQKRERRFGGVK